MFSFHSLLLMRRVPYSGCIASCPTPQTYQEIQPKFIKELRQLRYEKMPELMEILEENFLQDEDGRWYVPDLSKASDLAKLRQKRLLKDFEEYVKGTGKLKVFQNGGNQGRF